MQETYTSDFPGMKHWENIRTGYIMASTAAGSDNQLSGFCRFFTQVHGLHFSCLSPVFSLLFCFPGWGRNYSIINTVAKSNMQPDRAA